MTGNDARPAAIETAADALLKLGISHPELSDVLARLVTVVAAEATRTPRFANAVVAAVSPTGGISAKPKRAGRRAPGILDPFAIYGDAGEEGLRNRLNELDLEHLRDIVAEHGMDHDRLAMKWKDPDRVIERIVEKVVTRAAKGSAFRD